MKSLLTCSLNSAVYKRRILFLCGFVGTVSLRYEMTRFGVTIQVSRNSSSITSSLALSCWSPISKKK
jgi:hypothetical protein